MTAIVGLVAAFVYIKEAVLTLFLALFAALVLEPVVRLMQRKIHLGRGACATILVLSLTVLGVLAMLLLVAAPLADTFRDFVNALPQIVSDISNNTKVTSWLNEHSSAPETAQANVKEIAQEIGDALGGLLGVIVSGFSLVLSLVTAIFLTLFLMIDLPRLIGAVDTLLDPRGSDRWGRMSEQITTVVSRTMLGNIAISIICGTLYGLSAWALGTPFPVVMGVIAGLLDLIPMVGATISGVILVLATLTQGITPAVIMLIIVLVYQQVENYVLQPTILGKAADISGFFVIFSVMVFGALLGVIGAIIAVPIIASIQIVVRELTQERRARMARSARASRHPPSPLPRRCRLNSSAVARRRRGGIGHERNSAARHTASRGRRIAARVLLILGVLLTVVSILATYVKREALDQGQFKQTSQELIANPQIQQQVANVMVDALYNNVDVSSELKSKLPKNLQGLAAPIAGISRELADRAAIELLARPRAQTAFVELSSAAQKQFIAVLHGDTKVLDTRTATSSSTSARSCSGSATASGSWTTSPRRSRRARPR